MIKTIEIYQVREDISERRDIIFMDFEYAQRVIGDFI